VLVLCKVEGGVRLLLLADGQRNRFMVLTDAFYKSFCTQPRVFAVLIGAVDLYDSVLSRGIFELFIAFGNSSTVHWIWILICA